MTLELIMVEPQDSKSETGEKIWKYKDHIHLPSKAEKQKELQSSLRLRFLWNENSEKS